MSEMEREPWTNGESGSGAILDQEPESGPGPGNERKRARSSSGDSVRSGDGAETIQKKAKVTADVSFELSEKVSVPLVEKDVVTESNSNQSNNNSNHSGLEKKSTRAQVECLAKDRGLGVDFVFTKPPGFVYRIGQAAVEQEYLVQLQLKRLSDNALEHSLPGAGTSPYQAMREASKKALEYFTSFGTETLRKSTENIATNGDHHGIKNGDQKETGSCDDEDNEVTGHELQNGQASDNEINNGDDSGSSGDEDSPDESNDEDSDNMDDANSKHDWIGSLENFYAKALAEKVGDSVSIQFNKTEETRGGEISGYTVRCEIGKLSVVKTEATLIQAKQMAARAMLDTIETHLESKNDIIAMIVDTKPPPFRDETVVTDDDDVSVDKEDDEPYVATLDSSDDEQQPTVPAMTSVIPGPASKSSDNEAASGEMLPGVEYALALMRTDKPSERPILMDVANMRRRERVGMARSLLSSLQEGDRSDEEDEEEGRFMTVFQEMLSLAGPLSERCRMRMSEMISRSSLGLMRSLPGMMGGPGMMPVSQFPGRQAAATPRYPPAPVVPPKPVIQPLKELCKYPQNLEGVASELVSMEDYKTLATGTFLNDVIINFYLKYLQYTVLSEADKNRVHMFTTFWFSRLTQKPSPIEARKDPVIRRHDRVKRWTRKVNIFEKDFVVIPINENYHWYLCIICYPGQVGCQTSSSGDQCKQPARQRNRRRAKDKIKGLKAKMNALPRKDMSDERDEPLASEDEVEHEDDSVDVELWKKKLVKWEEEEVIRKAEEEERLREAERQRREYEENLRKYQEEQQRLYEEQLAQEQMRREEEHRRLLEAGEAQEDMEEGEESWDDENFDEDPYNNELMDDPSMVCNEYGEPVEMVTVPGMFSDFGNYKTSVDILGAAMQSVKGQAMAADWDDWGEAEEMETDMASVTEPEVPQFYSMVTHMVTGSSWSAELSASAASHSVVSTGQAVSDSILEAEVNEEECLASSVTHNVSLTKTTASSHVEAVLSNLQHLASVPEDTIEVFSDKIAQVDGINDDSSDEDMEQDDEDEHLVPDPAVPQAEGVHFQEDSDSSVSVQDVTFGQPENNQRDDKSDSDTEVEEDNRREERDDSSPDDEDSKDSLNRQDNNEISNEAGESYNYDRHGDASDNYASDFDDEVNERRRSDDESSVSTEGYDQDDVRDQDTKDDAPEVQSDSDIEEVEEIEEVTETRRSHYDDEDEDDEDREDQYDEENEKASESESEYEEEDISEDVPVKQPCILVFDSLGGRKDRQARLCATLRDYLTMEYQEKYPGQKREFSTKTIPGCAPKVPQQPNLTDCGIYVCHNVETFFKSPIEDYTLPITSLKNWFPGSEPRAKRGDVATIIRRLATEQNQDKLERLIWPEMVFMEPEKPRFETETERRRSDGESEREDEDDISDDEYYSEEERDDRGHKRYRSDNSSDEDRSPQRRRRDDNSDSETGFDASAVYGARADPIRNLPPGISISRSSESTGPRDHSQSSRQDYPTPLRRLPPGISISKQGSAPPPPVPSSPSPPPRPSPPRARPAPRTPEEPFMVPKLNSLHKRHSNRQVTWSSGSEEDEETDTTEVRVKPLFDDGDDNVEIFDLDTPAHTRTYLSPNSFRTLQEQQQYWASVRAETSNRQTYFSSMASHQVAHEVVESCLSSMVAHQLMKIDEGDDQHEQDTLPQLDGMEDFDSEDELQVEAAESVPVNEDVSQQAAEIPLGENIASEDINQPVEIGEDSTGMSEEFSLPETTTEHGAEPDSMTPSEFQGNMNNIFVGEIPQEIVTDPQSSNLPTEVAVDNNMEHLEQLVPGGESVLDTPELLTEETVEMDHDIVPEAQLADFQAPEVNGDFASAETDDRGNVEAFGELVSDVHNLQAAEVNFENAEEVEQGNVEEFVEEQGEHVEEFGELVENEDMEEGAQSEDFNDYEDYASDYEEDSQGHQDDYERPEKINQYQPPEKRPRMASDDEVVLDSDEDDAPPPAPQAASVQPSFPPRGSLNQYSQLASSLGHQQASFMSQHQAMMMAAQQQQGRLGAFNSIQQQQAAALYGLQQQQQFRDLQQQTNQAFRSAPRKRKLPSVALCIKDGRVYSKPFSSLPSSIISNDNKSVKTDAVAPLQPQQMYQAIVNNQLGQHQSGVNPYKPSPSNTLEKMIPQVKPILPGSYQRPDQRILDISNVVSNEDSASVEDYRSEEDPDIMDGEEVNDEVSRDESYRTDDEDDDIRSCDDDSQSKDDFPGDNHRQELRPSNKIEVNQISAESESSEDEDTFAQAVPSSNETSNDVEEAFDDNSEKSAAEVINAPDVEAPQPEVADLPDVVQSASDIMQDIEPQPEEVNQEISAPAPTEMAQEEEIISEESQEGVSL